ncbi:sulfotransferase family protein [Acuticoccus mangrovi]|uniref:Sulfotransferase n=1 Tax=Acuticoccus mangrovi TaxID=2796142 RepID=A0A934IGV1_9HYPH|nr:sulfotransferase [Acuticoccus mangrovi]MBJ3776449.1 sulfotransferase [Acuticoccus mangrovi]
MTNVKRYAFLGGSTRSGTTWLQILLGAHPKVATLRESHVFDRYVGEIERRYLGEESVTSGPDGLKAYIDADTLDAEVLRPLAHVVLDRIAATKPKCEVVLEKTPANLRMASTILRLFPEAHFLVIVRDPRAVCASMLAAAQEDWGSWADRPIPEIAREWMLNLLRTHHLETTIGPALRVVRYEDLHADKDAVLAGIHAWLGITSPRRKSSSASAKQLASRQKSADPASPSFDVRPNFFRKGEIDSWKTSLEPDAVAEIEFLCRAGMERYGYEPVGT